VVLCRTDDRKAFNDDGDINRPSRVKWMEITKVMDDGGEKRSCPSPPPFSFRCVLRYTKKLWCVTMVLKEQHYMKSHQQMADGSQKSCSCSKILFVLGLCAAYNDAAIFGCCRRMCLELSTTTTATIFCRTIHEARSFDCTIQNQMSPYTDPGLTRPRSTRPGIVRNWGSDTRATSTASQRRGSGTRPVDVGLVPKPIANL